MQAPHVCFEAMLTSVMPSGPVPGLCCLCWSPGNLACTRVLLCCCRMITLP